MKLDELIETYGAAETLDLKGRAIAYYPDLAAIFGGVTQAILLSQFLYWHGKERQPGGWIYKTVDEIKQETGLSKDEQQTARRTFRALGLLDEEKRGLPARNHYRFKWEKVVETIVQWRGNRSSSEQESRPLVEGKAAHQSAGIPPTYKEAEITQGITQRNTNSPLTLPHFIPKESWDEFLAHRQRKRAPVSRKTAEKIWDTIGKLKDLGHDPKTVLEDAIDGNWTSIEVDWVHQGNGILS